MGWIYTIAVVGAGVWFIAEAHRLYHAVVTNNGEAKPMRVFHLSITYLTLVFIGVGLDPIFYFPLG